MTAKPRRVRTKAGATMPQPILCGMCRQPGMADEMVKTGRKDVCFTCAWEIVEGLGRIYNAPEITALERIKFRAENGNERFRKEPEADLNPGWVYYIRMGDMMKIGYATDVSKRMRAYPPNAELLAAHPGTKDVEKFMHRRFAEFRERGREWFTLAPEIMEHIAGVVEQYGDKSHLAYEYTKPKTQEERVSEMFATREHIDVARGVHVV